MENQKNNFEAAAADTQVMRRKEVQGELNFIENLDELDAALEADNIVARFNNPNGEVPIDFEMRPMTPRRDGDLLPNAAWAHTHGSRRRTSEP